MRKMDKFQEFKDKQNCPWVECDNSHKAEIGPSTYRAGFLFENGAFTDLSQFIDPPKGEIPNAIMRVQYIKRILDRKEAEFRKSKEIAAYQARFDGVNVPTIHEGHIEHLESLQKEIKQLRKRRDKLQRTIDNDPVIVEKRRRKEEADREKDERDSKRRELIRKLNEIEI